MLRKSLAWFALDLKRSDLGSRNHWRRREISTSTPIPTLSWWIFSFVSTLQLFGWICHIVSVQTRKIRSIFSFSCPHFQHLFAFLFQQFSLNSLGTFLRFQTLLMITWALTACFCFASFVLVPSNQNKGEMSAATLLLKHKDLFMEADTLENGYRKLTRGLWFRFIRLKSWKHARTAWLKKTNIAKSSGVIMFHEPGHISKKKAPCRK